MSSSSTTLDDRVAKLNLTPEQLHELGCLVDVLPLEVLLEQFESEALKALEGSQAAGSADLIVEQPSSTASSIAAGTAPFPPPQRDLLGTHTSQQWECSVCNVEQLDGGWTCPSQHHYCQKCMLHWVMEKTFPTCINPSCTYRLTEVDLHNVGATPKRIQSFQQASLQCAIDGLGELSGDTVFRCPNVGCNNVIVLPNGGRQRYECTCGAAPICTHCGQTPYHYHAACTQVQDLRHLWLNWLEEGRAEYHGHVRKVSYLATEQKKKLKAALERHGELESDEQWKAKHCRRCPRCKRPVQKTSGCNEMKCGSDWHGGNTQSGCGHKFDWSRALPYEANAEESKRTTKLPPSAARGSKLRHPFTNCNLCGSKGGQWIVGPRFRCIHCPDFNVCLSCEPKLADQHDAEHVFAILFEPEFDWAQYDVDLPAGTKVRVVHNEQASLRGKRKHMEGQEGIIQNSKKGRYTVQLSDESCVSVARQDVQPILGKKIAEKLLLAGIQTAQT